MGVDSKYRWLVLASWNRLHLVPESWSPEWVDENVYGGKEMTAACGASGMFMLPGFSSRFGLERCAHCCDRGGVPRGIGAPENERSLREMAERTD